MCEPTTLLIASTAMMAAGQMVQGVNNAASMRYRAKVGEQNAGMERAAARDALDRGAIEEQRQYRANSQRMGDLRLRQAASGIDMDIGSSAQLEDNYAQVGWEDAQTVRENAAREAKGYEINAWNASAGAAADRSAAKGAMWQTAFDVGGTLLSGAQQYRKMRAPQAAYG